MNLIKALRYVASASLTLLVAGPVAAWQGEAYLERRDRAVFAPPETFATLRDGRRLRFHDRGQLGPPIILVGGLTATLETWRALDAALPEEQRVIAYDRSGIGFSDPDPSPPSADRAADEIVLLLEALAIEGPVVPVCYSIGGLFCHRFAVKYPDRVVAMVLLDPTHPEEWSRVALYSAQANIKEFFTTISRQALKSSFGVPRAKRALKELVAGDKPRSAEERRAAAFEVSGAHWTAVERESTAIFRFHAEIQAAPLPSALPVIVFSSVGWNRPDVEQVVHQLHRRWSEQSTRGRHVLVDDTDHAGLRDDPKKATIVARATADLIEQIRPSLATRLQ